VTVRRGMVETPANSDAAKSTLGVGYTDKYFTNVRRALAFHDLNPWVKYRVFMRTDCRPIYKFVEEYLASHFAGKYHFKKMYDEGALAYAKRPLFELEGSMQDIIESETGILSRFGWPSLTCHNAKRIVDEVRHGHLAGVKLIDMAARHCPGEFAAEMASYAAHVAGFDVCSTDLGAASFGGSGVGTMPHAWIGAFPTTVAAAEAFAEAFPEQKISVLVDYYGQELDDAVACFKSLGDRLASVRIDTHGGRFCQGVTNTDADGDFAAITRLREEFGVEYAGIHGSYAFGKGVTVEAVYGLRRALDAAGGQTVGITVSSGFTAEKIKAFVDLAAPVTAIGTGSFLPVDIRDTYATMDIVAYDRKPKIKVGREWLL